MLRNKAECGACGNPDVTKDDYYNKEKDSHIRLCEMCAQYASINGYFIFIESYNRKSYD